MSEQVKRREMTLSCRQAAFCTLHSHLKDGVLERGALAKTAAMFNVNHTTMSRFWREMKKKIADDDSITDASDILTNLSFFESRKYSRGRHKKRDRGALRAAVREVSLSDRKTFRKLAKEVQVVPKSTLHNMFKREGLFCCHVSSLRPYLAEENKLARLFYALDVVYPVAGHDGGMRFKDMYDCIDRDEKCFFLTRERETYILIAEKENGDDDDDDDDGSGGETHPYRSVRNRSYISKVMFLCAQACPRWDTGTNCTWDGRIGIWPIGHFEQRSLRRNAGAPVWKDKPINREKYRELLLEKVVPAIVKKWPRRKWNNNRLIIRMQQDGAKSQIHPTDAEFQQALDAQGLRNKILLYTQPANSPNTNINDLGFFRALQSMYHLECPNDEGEIIEYVTRTYYDYDLSKIDNIWLTLMACYNQIIVHHGGNDYKIPHIGKSSLLRQGQLPSTLPVTGEALDYF